MTFREWLNKVLGRSDIPVAPGLAEYMHRWKVINKIAWGIRIHHILRGDADPEYHNHEFWYISFIFWGGYWEHRPGEAPRWYGPFTILFRRAEAYHRLTLPPGKTAWTIVLRGRVGEPWSFMDEAGNVTPWKTFIERRYGIVRNKMSPPKGAPLDSASSAK